MEAKNASKNWNQSVHIFWARLASFGHLGLISDLLMVSKFHDKLHDLNGQENKIYIIVSGRETFYRHHTVPVTSWPCPNDTLGAPSFNRRGIFEQTW